jgi:RNA 2',3'-cyclic 3'-phosphodiesterase
MTGATFDLSMAMTPNPTETTTTCPDAIPSPQMRVFVGVKIEPEIAGRLAGLARELEQLPVRLVPTPDIHLTLVPPWSAAFLTETVEQIRQTAIGFRAFQLTFRRLCYGPDPRRPRLLWAECVESDEISRLRAALLDATRQTDERPFRPHVTLARLRGNGAAIARRRPIDRELSFTQQVDCVELFQSPPPGAKGYRSLASLRLAECAPKQA